MTHDGESEAAGMTAPTLDPTALESLRDAMGDDELVVEIVEAFLDGTPSQVASLVDAGERGDLSAVVTLAHLVKGGALTFGAVRLVGLCDSLESAPADAGERVSAVAEEFEQLETALAAYTGALRAE